MARLPWRRGRGGARSGASGDAAPVARSVDDPSGAQPGGPLTARLYDSTGTDRSIDVLAEPPRRLDKTQLLWVDAAPGDLPRLDDALRLSLAPGLTASGARPGVVRSGSVVRLRVLGLVPEAMPERTVALDVIAARSIVITIHDGPVAGLDAPQRETTGDTRLGELDAAGFIGMLLDGVLGAYFAAVDVIERRVDELDERALTRREADALLSDLVALRRRISVLRRALALQRDAFGALVRPDFELQREVGSPWPGLADRYERAVDAVENARELLLGSFDIHMSRTAQRTNDIIQVLTIVSAILLPISTLAGIMGMNFPMPFFDVQANFWLVILAMMALAASILGIARLRRWI